MIIANSLKTHSPIPRSCDAPPAGTEHNQSRDLVSLSFHVAIKGRLYMWWCYHIYLTKISLCGWAPPSWSSTQPPTSPPGQPCIPCTVPDTFSGCQHTRPPFYHLPALPQGQASPFLGCPRHSACCRSLLNAEAVRDPILFILQSLPTSPMAKAWANRLIPPPCHRRSEQTLPLKKKKKKERGIGPLAISAFQ